ncbi:MAG TPA: glycosyltransferase [Patescibacteria group bacterium]
MTDIKNKRFCLITHFYTTGTASRVEEYLIRKKVKSILFIGHSFSYRQDTRSFLKKYEKGKLVEDNKHVVWRGPDLIFYLRDVFLTLYWTYKEPKFDAIICWDSLNAFTGVLLKLLGKTKKLVFYTIDYVPDRFSNSVLNTIYHWFDRFALRNCDLVWNLSSAMTDARETKGVKQIYRKKQMEVPFAIEKYYSPLPVNKIDRYRIVFASHLRPRTGIETLINVMPQIVKRIPYANLLVIGTGPLEKDLRKKVKNMKLNKHIRFTGYIEKYSDVEDLFLKSAIGVAPYTDDAKTFTRYADPGKPKDYLACGLPVVITKVPPVAYKIDKFKCGIAVEDDKEEIAAAIISLLTNRKKLVEYRKNAYKFAQKFSTDKVYTKAFKMTF